MAANSLRTQYPYGDLRSPRNLYDYPSPTSNYPSGLPGASPGLYPTMYQNTPRFGGSVFIPPSDVFSEGGGESGEYKGSDPAREARIRRMEALSDPVAAHLLVETAIGDSQHFEVLSIEEVEALKQEQRTLEARLGPLRKKLESETKIRDAARSLNRLSSKKDIGHRRGLSSRGSNAVQDPSTGSEEELAISNQKVDELTKELFELETRMRTIDTQLLMHTAAILQMTHNGPNRKKRSLQGAHGGVQRPDSPASLDTYDTSSKGRSRKDDEFDERSFYRTPENLDSLMDALQNGTHNHQDSGAAEYDSGFLDATTKRIEELNARARHLLVQANPQQNRTYSMPPPVPSGAQDPSVVDQQLDFLDKSLRDMSVELEHSKDTTKQSLQAVEGRLDGVNNQLFSMLSRTDDKALPPPPATNDGVQEQVNYLEDSLYHLEQIHSSMSEQVRELQSQAESMTQQMDRLRSQTSNDQDSQYETTLMGLWSIMQAGEEEARQRKRQRREMLAADPDADEELSPDEDFDPNEQFSLTAFSAKVQSLYSKATSLKEKQRILVRQIKQQRELNSRSDAQKEEQFDQLREQILSARSEKVSMEKELERAIDQLKQFDQEKVESDSQALKEAHERIHTLENQLREAQDDSRVEGATIRAELAEASAKMDEVAAALRAATQEKEEAQARAVEANNLLQSKETELRNLSQLMDAKEDELRNVGGRLQAQENELQEMSNRLQAHEGELLEMNNLLESKDSEIRELESEMVRLTTEVTLAKAELDGAYGTRAERAAESGAPIRKELEELSARNAALLTEIEMLKSAQDAASRSEAEARESERALKQELTGMAADYEALTRDLIQNEKDRDVLEASIDRLRDEKEALELELSDERVRWLGIRSPGAPNGTPVAAEATSIRMLREDFRKMMRDRTAEGLRALRNEQEERRKLEALVRTLRREAAPQKSGLSKQMTA